MARDGKWLRVVADGCNQLQPLAATCSGSHLAATWQPLGSHLAATWQPLAATRRHLPQVVAANGCQVAAKWLPEQVAASGWHFENQNNARLLALWAIGFSGPEARLRWSFRRIEVTASLSAVFGSHGKSMSMFKSWKFTRKPSSIIR